MTETVLVTGGAGYVGAHACKALARAGFTPVVFDNLSTGWGEAVKWGPLAQGDLMDRASIDRALADHRPVAVMHFAALSLVGEAVQDPARYWRVNLGGALNLWEACAAAGVRNVVLSSTCATYGDHGDARLTEDSPQRPINAYGGSKLAVERTLMDFGTAFGMRHVIFRYFNVAGADPEGDLGEQHLPETHLIPLTLDAVAGKRAALTIHGTDYPTADGTCVRDYVHVMDLAEAHVLGLQRLLDGKDSAVFCLGTGRGFSVREVIEASRAITNREVPVILGARRPGDAASLVLASSRATTELCWEPRRSTLRQMIGDAWAWAQKPGFRA
jgi:UDP-glucose 4-epimerase